MFKNPVKENLKVENIFDIYTYVPIYGCYVYVKPCEYGHSSIQNLFRTSHRKYPYYIYTYTML